MDARPRSLAANADPGRLADAQDWARLMRQGRPARCIAANAAAANVADQSGKTLAQQTIVNRAHRSEIDDHAVIGQNAARLVDIVMPGEHGFAHVGENEFSRADRVEMLCDGQIIEVHREPEVILIALDQIKVGTLAGANDIVGPSRVAGKGKDFSIGLKRRA